MFLTLLYQGRRYLDVSYDKQGKNFLKREFGERFHLARIFHLLFEQTLPIAYAQRAFFDTIDDKYRTILYIFMCKHFLRWSYHKDCNRCNGHTYWGV